MTVHNLDCNPGDRVIFTDSHGNEQHGEVVSTKPNAAIVHFDSSAASFQVRKDMLRHEKQDASQESASNGS